MKHIKKGEPLPAFCDFIRNEHPVNWDDIHRHPELYLDCRDKIFIDEQNALGGYTERPLLGARDLHIDHYRKKGMSWTTNVTFDWNNLIVEERNPNYGACYKDNHTSNQKDYEKLLNPVVDYPEKLMTYLPNGEIVPQKSIKTNEREKTEFTISRFNLNHPSLKRERETLMKIILEDYKQLSDEEIQSALIDNGYPTVVEWALAVRRINCDSSS